MGQAKQRNEINATEFKRLAQNFSDLGLNTEQVGFADHPAFHKAEEQDPMLLESYAKWVMLRPRNKAYNTHVRETVPKLAKLVATVLEEDKLEGSCQMACSLLTKGLDRLGVWSVGIVGSATFEVKKEKIWRGLHTVDHRDFSGAKLGHTWVCAPPYIVVDASIKRQRWEHDTIRPYIPSIILDDVGKLTKPKPKDIISARMRAQLAEHGALSSINLIYDLEPNLLSFGKFFPATEILVDHLTARYIPTAAGLSDGTFEEINTKGAYGRTGREIWENVILPEFKDHVTSLDINR